MFESCLVKRALTQMLTTLLFAASCLAASAAILINSPPAEELPGRAGENDIVQPKNDLRLATATDRPDAISQQFGQSAPGR